MGSKRFITRARGKNVSEAYRNAVEEATEIYGHQEGYSGEINCSTGYVDKTALFKTSKKDTNAFIADNWEHQSKYLPCWAICVKDPVGNTNKIKTQVEHIVEPGTKKWILMYKVVTVFQNEIIGHYKSKGEAVDAARRYTERTQRSTEVHMVKVLERGSTLSAKVNYKKSPNERGGEWVFFGEASC